MIKFLAMKNFLLLLTIFCLPVTTPAQVIDLGTSGTTRAVIIGISDYADDRIPDLRFAHRDALAFAEYLKSPAGGAFKNEQVALLTNEQATAGKVIAALTWLIAESKPNDRALLYFSGHGDVELVTKFQRGYLLCHDSPGTTYTAGGSLPVGFLDDVVATLSEAGVQVTVISDACRSGKLAGTANGGTRATTAALAQKLANEIKILSCQPDEFSIEGEEWGGGRGVFSYHLLDALYGFADRDRDLTVNLLEAQRYLQDTVPAESLTGQTPFTVGNPKTQLAAVLPESLAAWKQQKKQPGGLSPFAGKGMDAVLLAGMDSTLQVLYQAFNAALERGDLLTASATGQSANDYYLRLLREPEAAKLHGIMTRNLAAALQDEAQVVINQVLRTDPQIVDDAFSPVGKYDHLPAYLARAAELLGERHFMHRFLKAKEYYFRSKTYREENHPDLSPDSLLQLQLATLDTALGYDSMAAYLYFEKGYLRFWGMAAFPEIYFGYFEKSLALSPEWVLPLYFAGRSLCLDFAKCEESEKYILKAIMLDSSFFPAYREMGYLKSSLNKREESKDWFESYDNKISEYISKQGDRIPVTYYAYWGDCLTGLKRYGESVKVLKKGAEMSNYQHPSIFRLLTYANDGLGKYKEVKKAALRAIELNPLNPEVYHWVGAIEFYYEGKQLEDALKHFYNCLKINPKDYRCLSYLSLIYLQTNQLDSAGQVLQRWLNFYPGQPEILLGLAKWYMQKGMEDAANSKFRELLESDQPNAMSFIPLFYFKIIANYQLGNHKKVRDIIELARIETGGSADYYFNVACAHAFNGENKNALENFEKALIGGWKPYVWVWRSLLHPDLKRLSNTPAFQSLIKKYLPEYYKE